MNDNVLLTPDQDVKNIVKGGDVAIIKSDEESIKRHSYMWGEHGITLTQQHIDALLAGLTLTTEILGEYQVFITLLEVGE